MCNFGANPDALRDPGLVAGEDNGLAYVAVWRARYDAQIYTNGAKNLGEELSREVSHAARRSRTGSTTPANRMGPD